MTAVVTTLVGVVLALFVVQHRFVQRDVHRTQAVYRAEAAVYQALARLRAEPDWRPRGEALPPPEPSRAARTGGAGGEEGARVWARPYGGFWEVRADAHVGSAVASVRARFGEAPSRHFDRALALGDTLSALTLTGEARLTGGVRMGRRGLRTAPLRGRPFRGFVRGGVLQTDEDPLPRFAPRLFDETMDRLDAYLAEARRAAGGLQTSGGPGVGVLVPWSEALTSGGGGSLAEDLLAGDLATEAAFGDSLQVFVGRGAVVLDDAALPAGVFASGGLAAGLRYPVLILVEGDLDVSGPLRLAPGSVLAATGALALGPGVSGPDVLAYARTVAAEGAALSGQLLARDGVRLAGGARLAYPSVVYVEGADGGTLEAGPGASVEGTADSSQEAPEGLVVADASVDGTLIYPALGGVAAGREAPVRLGERARLRGVVYANTRTDITGRLDGALLTRQLHFYEAPATYLNWLRDATIDRTALPAPFAVPIGFDAPPSLEADDRAGVPPRYEVVAWDERTLTPASDA